MIKLDAKELRETKAISGQKDKIKRNPVYIILDNVLDTYNIGAVFRLADAVACKKIYLCRDTETPPNTRIKKASINTSEWVDWEYSATGKDAILGLKSQIPNLQVVAIEQSKNSVPYNKIQYQLPLALVVGHETVGVSSETLSLSDHIAELPMWGVNKSLNVMVSLGIVLYHVMGESRSQIGD